ncbi:unnamed protein product [Nippostrongylus brasiliensis]|uniref:Uncharacterized protein n=1 Tax=Nippostrongylus brasiliensis TaxID=27835 RepID=A0A158R048_NIPBR|nr:unnamed protein product [Nippostrongylus brasiliensis]
MCNSGIIEIANERTEQSTTAADSYEATVVASAAAAAAAAAAAPPSLGLTFTVNKLAEDTYNYVLLGLPRPLLNISFDFDDDDENDLERYCSDRKVQFAFDTAATAGLCVR